MSFFEVPPQKIVKYSLFHDLRVFHIFLTLFHDFREIKYPYISRFLLYRATLLYLSFRNQWHKA